MVTGEKQDKESEYDMLNSSHCVKRSDSTKRRKKRKTYSKEARLEFKKKMLG